MIAHCHELTRYGLYITLRTCYDSSNERVNNTIGQGAVGKSRQKNEESPNSVSLECKQ